MHFAAHNQKQTLSVFALWNVDLRSRETKGLLSFFLFYFLFFLSFSPLPTLLWGYNACTHENEVILFQLPTYGYSGREGDKVDKKIKRDSANARFLGLWGKDLHWICIAIFISLQMVLSVQCPGFNPNRSTLWWTWGISHYSSHLCAKMGKWWGTWASSKTFETVNTFLFMNRVTI